MNLSKLEAVNRMLRAANEHPVGTLGSGGETDSLVAEQILDEITLREQMIGLHLNTVEVSFTVDTGNNNRVVLPSNTMEVKGSNQHECRNYFHREVNGEVRLFDADEQPASDNFEDDATVYVRLTYSIDFDDLPLHHQFSIADQAAAEYQMAVLKSQYTDRVLTARAQRSRAIARAYDMRSRPHNQFNDGLAQGPRWGTRYVPRSWPYNDRRQQG